jgi:hypothetical protein
MIWFRIRRAQIDAEFRKTFEHYGVSVMQQILAGQGSFWDAKRAEWIYWNDYRVFLPPWLTEQYDRAERKETWMITMEAAVTVLVLFEVILSIVGLWHHI